MSLEAIYFISQIVSALAIVASLIFVALQMRQADRTQRAMMHQLRAQRGMDLALRSSSSEISQSMAMVFSADRTVTDTDLRKIGGVQRAMIQNLVDTVWQHKAGLLDQTAYDYTIAPMRTMFSFPGSRALWLALSPGYSEAHVKMVNELLIDGQAMRSPPDMLTTWRAITTQLSDQVRTAPGAAHQP